jgi:hypothetical protein
MFVCFVKLEHILLHFFDYFGVDLKKIPLAKELCLHEQFEFEFEKKVLIVVGHLIDELL